MSKKSQNGNVFENDPDLNIREELLSLHASQPFIANNSAARGYMFSSHFSQCLTLRNGEEKIIQSGLETQFAQNTFSKVIPEDAKIIRIIKRYSGLDANSVDKVTEIIIIFETFETEQYDFISIPYYFNIAQGFGFIYKQNEEIINNLRQGDIIKKGTILADSPSVTKNNGYKYGLNANVCLINLPETTEDGVVISESFAEKLTYDTFEKRTIEFGSDSFPLNLYGDELNYKSFPEIGDLVGPDSVLMAIRKYDDVLCSSLTSINDVKTFNPLFDKAFYVKSPGYIKKINGEEVKYGEIVDIKVYTSNKWKKELYTGTSNNIEKYSNSLLKYYKDILDTYEYIKKEHFKRYGNNDVKISESLHKLIVDALAVVNPNKAKIAYRYKNEDLDNVRIEFVIAYRGVSIERGFKISGLSGDKGVIVDIRPDSLMPYYEINGEKVVTDVVMDPSSLISRMNIGRSYEHYFNAISRQTRSLIKQAMNFKDDKIKFNKDEINKGWDILIGLLKIIGTEQYDSYLKIINIDDKLNILLECMKEEVYIYYKVSSKKKPYVIVNEVQGTIYQPQYTNLLIPTDDGIKVSKEKILIAPLYIILHSKTPEEYLSVSGAKVNHFGLPIVVSSNTRNFLPYRSSPAKILSETETRLYLGYGGRENIAELKDRANSIPTHKEIYKNILEAQVPTNIDKVVDRNKTPFGNDSALELINNIFNVSGIEITYENDGDEELF